MDSPVHTSGKREHMLMDRAVLLCRKKRVPWSPRVNSSATSRLVEALRNKQKGAPVDKEEHTE